MTLEIWLIATPNTTTTKFSCSFLSCQFSFFIPLSGQSAQCALSVSFLLLSPSSVGHLVPLLAAQPPSLSPSPFPSSGFDSGWEKATSTDPKVVAGRLGRLKVGNVSKARHGTSQLNGTALQRPRPPRPIPAEPCLLATLFTAGGRILNCLERTPLTAFHERTAVWNSLTVPSSAELLTSYPIPQARSPCSVASSRLLHSQTKDTQRDRGYETHGARNQAVRCVPVEAGLRGCYAIWKVSRHQWTW
ncbi:hypothetical protein B0T20DRAFT_422672 [Sordaria brevicollis]|uniref:Uncharacterized protein n=1 Tax=Sordaria brevicollis TaxID=83679 RepID=A0AAE0P287_SORBR|nr:hypothetical protein B0T20DRAFT_422672 [Sordaria brevicollis]